MELEQFSIRNVYKKPSWLKIRSRSSKNTHYAISYPIVKNVLEWSMKHDVEVLWWKEQH